MNTPTVRTYRVYTIDGTVLATFAYGRNQHQQIGDFVGENLAKAQGPYAAYSHTDALDVPFPYTAWRAEDGMLTGHPCKDFDEVVAFVQGKRIVRMPVRFPTGLMNRHMQMRMVVDDKQFEITHLAFSVEEANAHMLAHPGEALIDTWLVGGQPRAYVIAKNVPL